MTSSLKPIGSSAQLNVRKDVRHDIALPTGESAEGLKAGAPAALESLGSRLAGMRRSIGMTQIEVAFRMGTTQPSLARLEKGDTKPNLRTLSRYAEALGQRVRVSFDATAATAEGVASNRHPGRVNAVKPASGQPESTSRDADELETIPGTLANLRKSLGITQNDVASRMETTQPVIARLESGDGVLNLRTLERYSAAIGVKMAISFEALPAQRT